MSTVVPVIKEFNVVQYLIILSIMIILIILIIYAWNAFVVPFSEGKFLKPKNVYCEVAPTHPINLKSRPVENRVYLSWNPTAFTDSYRIYLARSPNFQIANAERTINVDENRAVILNLIPGGYYVKISSVNTCGISPQSTENSFEITTFPSKFRICKKDTPSLCIVCNSSNAEAVLVDIDNISYTSAVLLSDFKLDSNQIKTFDNNFCLNDSVILPQTVEETINFQTCPGNSITWNFDLQTGQILSSNNLLLGASSLNGGNIFVTSPSVLFNLNDSRYLWEIQARTF